MVTRPFHHVVAQDDLTVVACGGLLTFASMHLCPTSPVCCQEVAGLVDLAARVGSASKGLPIPT